MFAKSQKERTSSPLFPALPIVVAVSFSLTLQAFAQGSSQATSQAGSAASTNNRSAAATKAATGATTAAASKASTQASSRATTANESKSAAPTSGAKPAVYEGDVKTGAGKATTDAKAGDTTGKKKKKTKEVEIVKTRVFESTNAKSWQTFPSYIELKPGQETLPLTLTVDNGPDEGTPMGAIRADLAGRRLFTEKNFAGKKTLKVDMTNALAPGPTQIVFSAFGAKGAKFSWKITSNASPTITKIVDESLTPGETARASGTLLPSETNLYTVKVGGSASSVVSVKENKTVEFKIPRELKPNDKGEVSIEFTISGQKIKPLTAKVVQPPEISSFSHVSVSAGTSFVISGKNFGTKKEKVRVTFNGTNGEVLSLSDTSITVMPPDIQNIPSAQTVAIEVNGVKCKREGIIQFSQFATSNDGNTPPFELGGAWRD